MTIRGINRQSYVIATAAHIGFAVTESKINKGMSFIFIFLWTKKKEMAGREEAASKKKRLSIELGATESPAMLTRLLERFISLRWGCNS
jgi:hypothetical protein